MEQIEHESNIYTMLLTPINSRWKYQEIISEIMQKMPSLFDNLDTSIWFGIWMAVGEINEHGQWITDFTEFGNYQELG